MKLLIAVQNCFPSSAENSLVFTLAWKRFVDLNKDKLNCDFVFMNNGLNQNKFSSLLNPYMTAPVPHYPGQIAWDTNSSWWPFALYHNQYTHIMRIDNDAFPTIEQLQSFITFIESNPDVDFISASNFCRPINNSIDRRDFVLDTTGCTFEEISAWQWAPWFYPTHNSDLYVIRTEFFRECVAAYISCPFTPNPQTPVTPFDTAVMTYQQICSLLNYKEERYPSDVMNLRLRIDGSINTDFWTILCSLKPKMAGVVNFDGGSFRNKNHFVTFTRAISQGVPFNDVADTPSIAYPHKLNVVAPYFHAGNAYVSACFFDGSSSHLNHPNTIGQFQHGVMSFALLHYNFVLLLARSSGHGGILTSLSNTMESWFKKNNIDRQKIEDVYNLMVGFLDEPLRDYLDQSNISQYRHVLG